MEVVFNATPTIGSAVVSEMTNARLFFLLTDSRIMVVFNTGVSGNHDRTQWPERYQFSHRYAHTSWKP
jgi:hypothetical protein